MSGVSEKRTLADPYAKIPQDVHLPLAMHAPSRGKHEKVVGVAREVQDVPG